jgi:DNA-binding response OmpR family regulator
MQQAKELLKTRNYRVAFLDLNPGRQNSLPLGKVFRKHNIPFAITTSYYDESSIPPDLCGIPIISKPYSVASVTAALKALLGSSGSDIASKPHIL